MARRFDRERLALPRRHRNVEIARLGGDAIDGALLAPEVADDHAHVRAVVVGHFRDVLGQNVLVARVGHLERARQIGPQLEAVHAAAFVALGHLLVEDP